MGVWDTVKSVGGALLPIAGPIGGVASSIIDAVSQGHANAANAQQAQQNREFQAQQSSTEYQRGVADLKAAGLNPAMAYSGARDSSASGSTATMQPTMQGSTQKFATALGLYNEMANASAQRKLIGAQQRAADAQALKTGAEAVILNPEAALYESPEFRNLFKQTLTNEFTARGQEARNYPTRFKADLNAIIGGTARSAAAADESRARTRLISQDFTPEGFNSKIAPWINATSRTIQPLGQLLNMGNLFKNIMDSGERETFTEMEGGQGWQSTKQFTRKAKR